MDLEIRSKTFSRNGGYTKDLINDPMPWTPPSTELCYSCPISEDLKLYNGYEPKSTKQPTMFVKMDPKVFIMLVSGTTSYKNSPPISRTL